MAGENVYPIGRVPEQMHYDKTWNINTIVSVVTLITFVFGAGVIWSDLRNRVEKVNDRVDAVRVDIATLDTRTTNVPNIEYRVGQTEAAIVAGQQNSVERSREIAALREDMNELSTSIKLILQSLSRLEEAAGTEPKRK